MKVMTDSDKYFIDQMVELEKNKNGATNENGERKAAERNCCKGGKH